MPVNWSYGGVQLIVIDRVMDNDQIIARLNPVGGGTVLQYFGDNDRIEKITAYVVGVTDVALLQSYTTSGVPFTYVTPLGSSISGYSLKHVSIKQLNSICQTIRPDLAEDSPVFSVDLELYQDL